MSTAAHADRRSEAAMQEGRRHYDLREWDEAIAEFKQAYKRDPSAAALFNIAQSYRQKGDCAAAAGSYKAYLRNYPHAKNRAEVEAFVTEMTECANKPPPVSAEPPTTTTTTTGEPTEPSPQKPVVVIENAPRRSDDHAWMRWTGYSLMGGGVIGLAVSTKFALDGRGSQRDLDMRCAISCTSGQANAINDRGHRANTRAWISGAVGGAALVGGVVFYMLWRDHAQSGASLEVTPTEGGATASLTLELD
jgi:tetratricopeptide (TPR) repeat protein